MSNQNEQTNSDIEYEIPSPEEMLQRLNNIDPKYYDIKAVADELKGNKIWISILTLPVVMIVLTIFTLLGAFIFDSPIISFLGTAAILLWIGKLFDNQQHLYIYAARQEVIRRIAETEADFGIVPHFKHFLPQKYRHLWQSVRKGNYSYIEQYVQAVVLLQHKIDPEKFTKIWYLTYPEIAPEEDLYEE